MIKTTTEALLKDPARWREAVKHDVVIAGEPGGDDMVLLSGDEYRRLKRRDVEVLTPADLSEDDIAEMLAQEIPPQSRQFDHEHPG